METQKPTPEEAASFRWGGTRARPRKGIEAVFKQSETYLKPPGCALRTRREIPSCPLTPRCTPSHPRSSCKTKWPAQGISVEIECCERCNIYILDPCDQVQIADCVDCRVVVGPCVGSLFLMDSKNCTFAVAAKQVRLRDVVDSELRVFAPTSECLVLEASKGLRIGPWDVAYPGLAAQFASSGWAPGSVNFWDQVYDFSPPEAGQPKHWEKLGDAAEGRWCELSLTPEGTSAVSPDCAARREKRERASEVPRGARLSGRRARLSSRQVCAAAPWPSLAPRRPPSRVASARAHRPTA
jgi:hypothetical protein